MPGKGHRVSKGEAKGNLCTGMGELSGRVQPWWVGSGGNGERLELT